MNTQHSIRKFTLVFALIGVLVLAGCGDNMGEQPKLDGPYAFSPTFGTAARELDPNAVPVGFLREDNHLYAGLVDGEPAETLPFELTQDVLDEGQRQYQAFCAPCHGIAGYGDGVISLEGFPRPASYHTAELRAQPVGHFFQVITNGVGNMYSYASRISPENRWAIAAYIRALQISQEADFATLPDEVQAQFESLN